MSKRLTVASSYRLTVAMSPLPMCFLAIPTSYLPPPVQNVCTPITTQDVATHGDSRSPTLAAFQNKPRKPTLCESINCGAFILTYVQVQMNSSRVTRKDWVWGRGGGGVAGVSGAGGQWEASRSGVVFPRVRVDRGTSHEARLADEERRPSDVWGSAEDKRCGIHI